MPDASSQMPGASRVGNRKERGSAPFRYGYRRVAVIIRCVGEFIYAEHPEGCSLQLFYRTSPRKERGFCPFRCGCRRVAVTICCMGEFVCRNTQRDVPYSCSTVPHPVRNAALCQEQHGIQVVQIHGIHNYNLKIERLILLPEIESNSAI